jgi:pSer/pThr/pTyr-binding forkhead associated (FHA) protein
MARLVITDGSSSRTIELTDATTVAGRAPENKIVIDDKQASRRHFQIDRVELGFKLVDLESRNGTRVNDRSVNQALLRPGDRIIIGKHVLTFEDPNFKEPPAEVAARLSPPSGAVGRVEAPSSSPDSSADRPGGLPVAQEVAKPAVAATAPPPPPPPPPPSADDYRRGRNRSGHTTAVQRNLQGQLREEQKTLTMVAVGAGVFIFVVLLLIFLPSSPSGGDTAGASKAGPKGPSAAEAAQAEAEAHDFEDLSGYCERNRSVPASYPEIIKRVEQFEQKYPHSLNQAKLKDYKAGAQNGLRTSRNAEFTEAEKQASEDLRKNDFAGGMKKIRDLLTKYKTDADIHERLVMLKDQAVEDARKYFQTKCLEADAMKSSRRDEAREIYQSLLKALGNGGVPEFDDYCKIARATLEGLQ